MSEQTAAQIEHLLRDNDLGWMIDRYPPKDHAIAFLLEQLEAVKLKYRQLIGEDGPFTLEAFTAEAERNSHKVRAFLQALRAAGSIDMVIMVWRILQGLSIHHVEMNYTELEEFSLKVVLSRPGAHTETLEEYRSHNIFDMRLLRNFGIGTITGKPLFAGYSPPREKSLQPAGPDVEGGRTTVTPMRAAV